MMNRIEKTFHQDKVYAAYLTAGDGSLDEQLVMIRALLAGGVTLLEIGIPFSDPIADGVVIQRAMHRALKRGTSLRDVMDLIVAIRRESDVPIIIFTYYNPLISSRVPALAQIKEAGADGVLVIDLPFFEADDHLKACVDLELAPILVISPSTDKERLKSLVKRCRGFLYYACQKGTTGVRAGLPSDLSEKLSTIKLLTDLPVIVGFGIADRSSSQLALTVADGFVVGSYFIQAIESGITAAELEHLARGFL